MKQNHSGSHQDEVLATERRSRARALLANQKDIRVAIKTGKREELTVLRDFISDGLPVAPGARLSAELKRLLKQTAQLCNSGLYARVLDALADKNNDATAEALRRGLDVREKMATYEGGAISPRRAARLLGASTSAVLRRARLYKLVAWRDWRNEQLTYRFPVWQFQEGRVLPGICKVLQAFKTWHGWLGQRDDWGVMLFFLASRRSLGGKRPLDLLRAGEIDRVLEIALWDDALVAGFAEGLRRIEDMQTGKVRGLAEAEFRAQLEEGTTKKQGRLKEGKRHRKQDGAERSKGTPTQQVLDWLNTPNQAFGGRSPNQILKQGKSGPLLRMLFERESGPPK